VIVARPWTWLHQRHGGRVVPVRTPGGEAGAEADAAVTTAPDAVLAVHTADCAPLALVSPEGPVGVVHAGWRGLAAGVVAGAVAALRDLGAVTVRGWLGPCIHPECYEFGPADLDRLAASLGPAVRGRTGSGRPALDLPQAVGAALEASGATLDWRHPACTACTPGWFSHRSRQDVARQALLVWLEDA
jgi:polyphenol oxidase